MTIELQSTQSTELPISLHIGKPETIWTSAYRATEPTHLIVIPVQLHKRNIETQLRKHAQPKSSLKFRQLRKIAAELLQAAECPATAIDRVDRLAYLRSLLASADADVYKRLTAVVGSPVSNHVEQVERTRGELELVTGVHPQRMEAIADAFSINGRRQTAEPAVADMLDLLAGVSQLQQDIQTRINTSTNAGSTSVATKAVSETSLLARATHQLQADPDIWAEAYPTIERLSVVGISMLSASVEDFCRVVANRTDTEVHLYLRPASGPKIAEQLAQTTPVADPGVQGVFSWR